MNTQRRQTLYQSKPINTTFHFHCSKQYQKLEEKFDPMPNIWCSSKGHFCLSFHLNHEESHKQNQSNEYAKNRHFRRANLSMLPSFSTFKQYQQFEEKFDPMPNIWCSSKGHFSNCRAATKSFPIFNFPSLTLPVPLPPCLELQAFQREPVL